MRSMRTGQKIRDECSRALAVHTMSVGETADGVVHAPPCYLIPSLNLQPSTYLAFLEQAKCGTALRTNERYN